MHAEEQADCRSAGGVAEKLGMQISKRGARPQNWNLDADHSLLYRLLIFFQEQLGM